MAREEGAYKLGGWLCAARTHGRLWRHCGCSPRKPSDNIRIINLNCEVVYHALVFAAAGRRFVIGHGYQKNTQKTPKPEPGKALKRMANFHSSDPAP